MESPSITSPKRGAFSNGTVPHSSISGIMNHPVYAPPVHHFALYPDLLPVSMQTFHLSNFSLFTFCSFLSLFIFITVINFTTLSTLSTLSISPIPLQILAPLEHPAMLRGHHCFSSRRNRRAPAPPTSLDHVPSNVITSKPLPSSEPFATRATTSTISARSTAPSLPTPLNPSHTELFNPSSLNSFAELSDPVPTVTCAAPTTSAVPPGTPSSIPSAPRLCDLFESSSLNSIDHIPRPDTLMQTTIITDPDIIPAPHALARIRVQHKINILRAQLSQAACPCLFILNPDRAAHAATINPPSYQPPKHTHPDLPVVIIHPWAPLRAEAGSARDGANRMEHEGVIQRMPKSLRGKSVEEVPLSISVNAVMSINDENSLSIDLHGRKNKRYLSTYLILDFSKATNRPGLTFRSYVSPRLTILFLNRRLNNHDRLRRSVVVRMRAITELEMAVRVMDERQLVRTAVVRVTAETRTQYTLVSVRQTRSGTGSVSFGIVQRIRDELEAIFESDASTVFG